ncbi:MAG: type I-C CRISPR-associated endonuclease Cas1 [Candidatus Omnitrophica bacterium]|nr:type I-C CRISPR-associated endonuclease Cas1 [Candidatus Omnitrophota bacterium]
MKRLLNTLYVTTPGAYLYKKGETVCVRIKKENRLSLPIHNLEGIVCFGAVTCSPPLMGFCGKRNVFISFLSEYGRFLARVQGPVSGNVLLRREQFRRADNQNQTACIARSFTLAKIANSRVVLQRALRDYPTGANAQSLKQTQTRLSFIMDKLRNSIPLEEIRGIEGDAARTYFSMFDHLIQAQKKNFFFHERTRRPPLDNLNALLSFLYTLLSHDCASALESCGLDPQVGFLHCDRPGRPGLALDLMEEFRAFLCDRLALSLINRKQIKETGFLKTETGAVLMNDATRKTVLTAYQKRKQDELIHPFLNERIEVGLLPFIQSLLLARFLRGDLDAYPPFLWK